jgi:hypothetical protein
MTRLADHFEAFAMQLRAEGTGTATGNLAGATTLTPSAPAATRVPTPAAAVGRTTSWQQVGDLSGQSYKWPPNEPEDYDPFSVFEAQDSHGSVRIGIGHADQAAIDRSSRKRPYLVTFEMAGNEKRRPLVVYTATDDHDTTGSFVGVIKGKGPGGKEMFGPAETLPPAYAALDIVTFRDQVSGPYSYNKAAVIAHGGDVNSLLDHALIQLRMRFS